MRGLPIETITQVQLLHENHPLVQDFLGWVYKRRDARLEATYLERQHERDRLSDLLQRPYADLATWPDLVRAYDEVIAPHAHGAPERCLDCQHCSPDKYSPGSYVCWLPYAAQGRPERLSTLAGCGAYTPSVFRHEQTVKRWLADHGIPYNAARWKGHAADLARDAGTWGFQQGTRYEQRVRQWLVEHYGADVLLAQRWLCAQDRAGKQYFRQVDGIEKVNATTAIVYEFKQYDPGYPQLVDEYVPLLRLAFPHVRFYPLEINRTVPYGYAQKTDPEVAQLVSLDTRLLYQADYASRAIYMLFVLDVDGGGAHAR